MAAGASLLAVPGALTACAGGSSVDGQGGEPASAASVTASEAATATTAVGGKLADRLRFSNWTLYIDVDEATGTRPTLDAFTREFGVQVDYHEDINSNEEFFGKVEAPLAQGRSIDRDIVVLTDHMAAHWVELGHVEKLNRAVIPNIKNLQPGLQSPTWDPNREYSLTWQSGMTGIAYDPERVGRQITSVDDLMHPKLKGKVTLLSEMADTLGLIMLSESLDPTTVTPRMIDQALAKLETMTRNVRQFTGNDYADMLVKGDIWACFGWSGDVAQLQIDNPNLQFVVPDAGGMLFSDNMLIPKGGDVYTASVYMDYVYRPDVAAKIEADVNFMCPVVGADESMRQIDPGVASNPLIFPPADVLGRLKSFDSAAANDQEYKRRFAAVAGV